MTCILEAAFVDMDAVHVCFATVVHYAKSCDMQLELMNCMLTVLPTWLEAVEGSVSAFQAEVAHGQVLLPISKTSMKFRIPCRKLRVLFCLQYAQE